MALAPGTRLGPYEVAGALGVGGMGEVYKARDTRLDRTVATRFFPPAISIAGSGSRARPRRVLQFSRVPTAVEAGGHIPDL